MTDRPDSRRTPLPSPSGANGPTPSRRMGNFTPIDRTPVRDTYGRQVGDFRTFAARHNPPQLRRLNRPEHSAEWHEMSISPDNDLVSSPSQQDSPPRLALSRSQYSEALSNPQGAPISILQEIERDLDDQIRDLQAVIRNNQEQLLRVRRHHGIVIGIIRNANGRIRRVYGVRARSPLTQEDNFTPGRIFHEHRTPANTPAPVRTPDSMYRTPNSRQRRYTSDGSRRFLKEKEKIKF